MKLRKAEFIVTVLILFILPAIASCERHTISEGVIVYKNKTPMRYEILYIYKN